MNIIKKYTFNYNEYIKTFFYEEYTIFNHDIKNHVKINFKHFIMIMIQQNKKHINLSHFIEIATINYNNKLLTGGFDLYKYKYEKYKKKYLKLKTYLSN